MRNLLFSSLLLTCFFGSLSAQTSYYIATTGNNSNNGALATPWRTIQYALNQVQPGNVLHVLAGTYNEKLTWQNSGTSSQAITLQNYNGAVVIVDGTGISATDGLLKIASKSHLLVKGLIFSNYYGQDVIGVYISGEGQQVSIVNCTIQNMGFTTVASTDPASVNPTGQAHGILINGTTSIGYSDLNIEGNTLQNLILGNSEALTLVGNTHDFTLKDNLLHDNTNIGIDVAGHYDWAEPDLPANLNQVRNGVVIGNTVYNHRRFSNVDAPAGIYVDGGKDILVEHNTSYSNGNGISVGCENAGKTAENITVRNNFVYDNDNHGIVFGANTGNVLTSTVRNNTLLKNGSMEMFGGEIALQKSSNCTVANNVLYARSSTHFAIGIFAYTATGLLIDHNLLYRVGGNTAALIQAGNGSVLPTDVNSILVNPLLVNDNLPLPDLHLQSTSPAINAGNNTYLVAGELDIDGDARQINGTVEIGADERSIALPVEYAEALQAQWISGYVQLSWETATEHNTERFNVEKSNDGINWVLFSDISAGKYRYTLKDYAPFAGVNYYRLKQLDYDGTFEYGGIVVLVLTAHDDATKVFPNPGHGTLHITSATGSNLQVQLFDSQGILQYEGESAQLTGLQSGHYVLRLTDSKGKIDVFKIVVANR